MKNRFVIVVTQRNAAPFIGKCLDSVLNQTYKNYIVPIMDDCSDDGTWEIVKQYPEPFYGIRNEPQHEFCCVNFITAINSFANDDDILVLLSGDDWLYSDDVLEYLNEVYQDDNIWLTYGSFISSSGAIGADFCKPLVNTRTYRRSRKWYTSHLITCRKKLWIEVKGRWLKDAYERFLNFKQEYSTLFIQVIGPDKYKEMIKKYKSLIYLEG